MQSLTPLDQVSPVEVIAISEREWRISDPTKVERDGLALLGFVELVGATYEVTVLGEPGRRYYFGSLEESVRELAQRRGFAERPQPHRPRSACA